MREKPEIVNETAVNTRSMFSLHGKTTVRRALVQSQHIGDDSDNWFGPYGTRINLASQYRDRSIHSRIQGTNHHHHPEKSTKHEVWTTRHNAREFNIDPLAGAMISKIITWVRLPRLLRSMLRGSSIRYQHDHSDRFSYFGNVSKLCSSHRPLTPVSWPRGVQGILIVMYSVIISNK